MDAVIGLVVLPVGCIGLLTEAYFRTNLNDAQDPYQCSNAQALESLDNDRIGELHKNGIVVIENVLSRDRLCDVQRDIDNSTVLQASFEASGNSSDVRQDRVQWVRCQDNNDHPSLDLAIALVRGVAFQLEAFDGFFARRMRVPRDCQLAIYPGDSVAGYARHVDRCTNNVYKLGLLEYLRLSDFRTRAVTVILYLNDPNRKEDEGGALRYWDQRGDAIDIYPRGGKLVVFDASRISHQVLPSKTKRTALTCWITGVLAEDQP